MSKDFGQQKADGDIFVKRVQWTSGMSSHLLHATTAETVSKPKLPAGTFLMPRVLGVEVEWDVAEYLSKTNMEVFGLLQTSCSVCPGPSPSAYFDRALAPC